MAEPRRVHLTTLSCDLPSSSDHRTHNSPPWTGVLLEEDNRPDRTANTDTVRLVLTLSEPGEQSFPEFSYSQLVENKIKRSNNTGRLSKFEEEKTDNDEVTSITRKLEAKYGSKPKKKKDRIQDLIDIGYGYDDEDSFIDNSEAYDEFVPAAITTKFGGFYINSGVLQFRQVSDSETENTAEEKTLKLSKKRKLNTGQEKPKGKLYKEDKEMRTNMDSRLRTLSKNGPVDEIKRKKKKRAVGTLSVTSMLKKFQREKEREKMENANLKVAGITGVPAIPLCPADAAGGGGSGLTDPLLSLIGSINDHALIQAATTVDFDIDLVSLLDATEETLSPKLVPQPATKTQLIQPKTDSLNDDDQARPSNTKTSSWPKTQPEQTQLQSGAGSHSLHQCIPLPEGLTQGLEQAVKKLMMAVKTSEGESKLKFFTPEINSILLDIELQCREQGGSLRSKLYTYLSSFLPCSRDTLLKRVKKLLLTHTEPLDMEDPIQKLSEAIGKAMPEQIACYHANCLAYEQLKASKATEEGNQGKQNEDNVEEKGVTRGGPKKVFRWNEEIRECLCNVLKPKMDKYEKERSGNQEIEEYLKTLLDSDVKPLWPKGWMQSRALMRESRKLLGSFASLPVKKARSDKKQSSTSGTSEAPSLEVQVPPKTDVSNEGSNISMFMPQGTTVAASYTPVGPKEPLLGASAGPSHSPLDLLADQALARVQPLVVPQEILTAAIIKYKRSGQHWSFGVNMKSPPPAPQSSPVGFPESRVCQVVLPQLLQTGDFAMNLESEQVQRISDDSFITIP